MEWWITWKLLHYKKYTGGKKKFFFKEKGPDSVQLRNFASEENECKRDWIICSKSQSYLLNETGGKILFF